MPKLYEEGEKFIKDVFWSESHNKDNKLNIIDTVHAKLVKDNEDKDPEYYAHRDGVVHVTSLSKCLRGVVVSMLKVAEKDEKMDARKLGVFKAGNLFEDFIVDAMGEKMLDRQTEYVYKHKGVILTGRDDGTVLNDGVRTMLENKSVHTDSFWYREKEGTLVATQNQMQIQTYLWLRRILPNVFIRTHADSETEIIYTNLDKQALWEYRGMKPDDILILQEKPDNSALNGIFCYISKDDCMIAQAPVKFNQRIIDEVVLPALDVVADAYESKSWNTVPLPALTRFEESKHQWQVNWVCKYCEYHNTCAGAGWLIEAQAEVKRKNTELKSAMVNHFAEKSAKPVITVAPIIGFDPASPEGDSQATVIGEKKADGTIEIVSVDIVPKRNALTDVPNAESIPPGAIVVAPQITPNQS